MYEWMEKLRDNDTIILYAQDVQLDEWPIMTKGMKNGGSVRWNEIEALLIDGAIVADELDKPVKVRATGESPIIYTHKIVLSEETRKQYQLEDEERPIFGKKFPVSPVANMMMDNIVFAVAKDVLGGKVDLQKENDGRRLGCIFAQISLIVDAGKLTELHDFMHSLTELLASDAVETIKKMKSPDLLEKIMAELKHRHD